MYVRSEDLQEQKEDEHFVCVSVSVCRISFARGPWHEWVVKMAKFL